MERADLEQWKAREVARLLALVETERRYYQEIVASIPVGLLVLSTDLSIISANRAIKKIFGLRSGDSVRGRLDTLLPGWVLDRVTEVLKTGVAQTSVLVETEHEVTRKLRVGILAIRNWDDEASQEALLTIEDLSGIEVAPAAEAPAKADVAPVPEEIIESAQPSVAEPAETTAAVPVPSGFPASDLIENLDAIIWAVELPAMHFLFVSRQAEKVLGFATDHWTANPSFWADRVHAADRDWLLQSYREAIERGEGHSMEFRAMRADGSVAWLRESARMLTDSEGRPSYLIGVTVDVTERRQLEDQLLQSERVEAVSRLASRMAHDLNNMLMILTGYGEELLNELREGSPLRDDVQEILEATERMSGLTTQLLSYARRQGVPMGPIALESVLNEMEESLGAMVGSGIEIDFQLSEEMNRVEADVAQLEQVVKSIVERAHQAMRGEGRITVETSRADIHEDLRRAGVPLRPGAYGVITISTTGRPIEGDARASLFESLLSKDPGEDLSAAISRAYGIVRQWGGDLLVINGPAEGSLFRVYLRRIEEPVQEQPAEQPKAAEPEPVPEETEAEPETILVVEDEAGIRALIRKILRRQGFQVLEAANGDQALAVCREHTGPIDLLITDVMMPQMGGRELVDHLHAECPDMKVLYVSGYTDDTSIYAGNLPPGTAFLQKPFTLGSLLDKVKEILSVRVS